MRLTRLLLIALFALCALPAAAQTPATAGPELERAAHALGAIWRPLPNASEGAAQSACQGAVEEMAAVESALPPILTPESLARVRALRGFLVVPTEDPHEAYFFPGSDLPWFTSGLGTITVISEAEGFIGVQDAAGLRIPLQLGRHGELAMLRIRSPDGAILDFVGCAATSH